MKDVTPNFVTEPVPTTEEQRHKIFAEIDRITPVVGMEISKIIGMSMKGMTASVAVKFNADLPGAAQISRQIEEQIEAIFVEVIGLDLQSQPFLDDEGKRMASTADAVYKIRDVAETKISPSYWDEWGTIACHLQDNDPDRAIGQLIRKPIKKYRERFQEVEETDLNRARIERLDELVAETNLLPGSYASQPKAVVAMQMKKNIDEAGRLIFGAEFNDWFALQEAA